MSRWLSDLAPALASRQQEKLYRQRFTLDTAQGPLVQLKGHEYLNFSSNDYLGLANHPSVISAFQSSAEQFGVGAGASHLVVGHQQPHEQLEVALAAFTGRDRALLFSSGYMANLGVLKALLAKDDVIIQDKLNHASLIDGGLASGAQLLRYRHNDLDHLEQLLTKSAIADRGARKILAVDGVFSMDGDIAPLDTLADICNKHDVALMVDDAHGFGVLGEQGAGCSEHFGLDQQRLPIIMGTLGKAFGVSGAFVAGSHEMIETLIQFSRTYIYTTALPPACASAALQSLSIIKEQPERRQHLQDLIVYFRKAINDLDFNVLPSTTAIQPIIIGDSEKTLALSQALLKAGLLVTAIRPPTVPMGTARLRVTLTAAHSFAQIDQLIEVLRQHAHLA
jgi:8-amino-7-oxononanoate synthase